MSKVEKDKKTLEFMINIYCENKHKLGLNKCSKCQELYEYAANRLDKCKFGENKTSCKKCTIHCFHSEKREQIKQVMRFSGPRVIFYRPHHYIRYILKLKKVKNTR